MEDAVSDQGGENEAKCEPKETKNSNFAA